MIGFKKHPYIKHQLSREPYPVVLCVVHAVTVSRDDVLPFSGSYGGLDSCWDEQGASSLPLLPLHTRRGRREGEQARFPF